MADSVFISVASNDNFVISYNSSQIEFGTVSLSWRFHVKITIYEEPRPSGQGAQIGKLECYFDQGDYASARFNDGRDTGSGGGFWNAAGIMWGDGVFTEQSSPLPVVSSDTEQAMVNQLDAATSDYFVRFSFCDNDEPPVDLKSWSKLSGFTRIIYQSELDPNGNLPALTLARLFSRWYDWETGNNLAMVTDKGTIESSAMNIDWHYYPWARKLSGDWESCNRDFDTKPSSSRSAYLRRKESGSWQDVLNNIQDANDQMSWRKQGGSWKYALPYGNNA